jgi:hypothetical protein
MRVRVRSLRTALLATMLVPAMAVPAAAATSAPVADATTVLTAAAPINHLTSPAKSSQVKKRSYRLRTAKGSVYSLVEGQASVRRQGGFAVVRIQSGVRHVGKGCSLVTVRQRFGGEAKVNNFRLCGGSRSIDFERKFATKGSRARVIIIIIIIRTCDVRARCSVGTYNTTVPL